MFLGASASQADIIEDQIQETFVLAWERRHRLIRHPNPAGWLVETFRRRLMAQCRRLGREGRRRAYSLDEESRPDMPDGQLPAVEALFESQERLALLRRLLGERDADIFLCYCVRGAKRGASGRRAWHERIRRAGVRIAAQKETAAKQGAVPLRGFAADKVGRAKQ